MSGNTIKLTVYAGSLGKDQDFPAQQCTGTFSASCATIDWGPQGCFHTANPNDPPPTTWCGAWTPNCSSPSAPYGLGMSLWDVFDNNMVLQMEPAAAAVYGIAPQSATDISVTITEDSGTSYTVQAKLGMDAVHQPFGPKFAAMVGHVPGPFFAWKVLLKPTAAGGNYTIFANCTGCTETGDYSNASITNVTFGDVWHCSGQSNMWLPLSSSFNINETIGNITSMTNPKYRNIRMMAGNSGGGNSVVSNPWLTAFQAASPSGIGKRPTYRRIVDFGATCWYFAQKLTDEMEASAGNKKAIPIGLTDTAIGGQRIEEYMVNDTTIYSCSDRLGGPQWNGHLYATMTVPFVDMTVKGFLWYQGENNMFGTKGNSLANVGYACEQKALVAGWRKVWSETPGTTDPMAPFGIVTLASSGTEGGPNLGPMRQAQTASYGMLPGPSGSGMENTFFTHAYDLDDEWGPAEGPCFAGFRAGRRTTGGWQCCPSKGFPFNATSCTSERAKMCITSCNANTGTPSHGGIHPRSKKHVGDRLGMAAFNTVYGGTQAFTGPTLSSCDIASDSKTLNIAFNTSLLKGDKVTVGEFPPVLRGGGGSQLYVQINASLFCMEPQNVLNKTTGKPIPFVKTCPTWAGGSGHEHVSTTAAPTPPPPQLDTEWIMLNYTLGTDGDSLSVDLTSLNGSMPTAVRYAWGIVDCCDYSDPNLYVTHGCVANCPIMSSSSLPANPFMAKIISGKCECIAPQLC